MCVVCVCEGYVCVMFVRDVCVRVKCKHAKEEEREGRHQREDERGIGRKRGVANVLLMCC